MRYLRLVSVRRSLIFLADIGVPSIVGILLHQPAGALLGCVCGLLFSLADQDGPLRGRYAILLMAAGAVALGGIAGILLHGFSWPTWFLFVAATFLSGALLGAGKAPMLSARFGAMALVVTCGAPVPTLVDAGFGLLALATAAVVRAVDHTLAGPLPQLRGGPPPGADHDWLRFALAYAAAAAASLAIGIAIDASRALWVVVTTLVVMQADARASYVRIVERVAGTAIGVVAAFAVTSFLHSTRLIGAAILVVAPLIPHHLQERYWLFTAFIVLLIMLAYDLGTFDPRILHGLFTERLEDVLLGGGIAVIGTMVAFPRKSPAA